jgi:purine nucleosidase
MRSLEMSLRVVIDTDTASDDAIALMMAVAEPRATIEAVTTVAGNVPIELSTFNALYTLELMGADDIAVYEGCDRPLLRQLETAQWVHGLDGMGDLNLTPPRGTPKSEHAVDALLRLSKEHEGALTLVTLGPLTNVAAAIIRDRNLLTRFESTYIMGGAPDGVGNVSAVGEFNVWADPEAAAITLGAAGRKVMVGWNISRTRAVIGPAERRILEEIDTPYSRFALDINTVVERVVAEEFGLEGFDLPDPITMAVALDPSIITRAEDLHVGVVTGDDARGLTYPDHRRSVSPPPNTTVVWDVDGAAFRTRLYETCRGTHVGSG